MIYNKQLKESKMAETTEFIGGMEKIIAFIKSQGEKVKNLEDELSATNAALEIVKDENEVNKKNMMKFMKENKELKQKYQKCIEERMGFGMSLMSVKDNLDEILYGDKDNCPYDYDHDKTDAVNLWDSWDVRLETITELKEKITCLESDSHNEVSQAEYDDLKEELRMSRLYEFFRECEAYNGFHKDVNLYDQEWLNEMYVMFEERRQRGMPATEELYKEYKEWIDYEPEEEQK